MSRSLDGAASDAVIRNLAVIAIEHGEGPADPGDRLRVS